MYKQQQVTNQNSKQNLDLSLLIVMLQELSFSFPSHQIPGHEK